MWNARATGTQFHIKPLRGSSLLLHEPAVADRPLHVLRLFAVPRAVLELDRRERVLPGAGDDVGALLAAGPRPRHDVVVDTGLVERLLHPPARVAAELDPHVRASMELHRHSVSLRR